MCHHGKYDDTLRVEQSGPSDVYMCTHVITVVTGNLYTPIAPPLKFPVSRAEW